MRFWMIGNWKRKYKNNLLQGYLMEEGIYISDNRAARFKSMRLGTIPGLILRACHNIGAYREISGYVNRFVKIGAKAIREELAKLMKMRLVIKEGNNYFSLVLIENYNGAGFQAN
jgi:hypothetical protein